MNLENMQTYCNTVEKRRRIHNALKQYGQSMYPSFLDDIKNPKWQWVFSKSRWSTYVYRSDSRKEVTNKEFLHELKKQARQLP